MFQPTRLTHILDTVFCSERYSNGRQSWLSLPDPKCRPVWKVSRPYTDTFVAGSWSTLLVWRSRTLGRGVTKGDRRRNVRSYTLPSYDPLFFLPLRLAREGSSGQEFNTQRVVSPLQSPDHTTLMSERITSHHNSFHFPSFSFSFWSS